MSVGEHSLAKLSSQSSGFCFSPLLVFANLYQFNMLLSSKYTARHRERKTSVCLPKFIEHKLFITICNTSRTKGDSEMYPSVLLFTAVL